MRFAVVALISLSGFEFPPDSQARLSRQVERTCPAVETNGRGEKPKTAFEWPADTSGYTPDFVIDCEGEKGGPILRIPPVGFDQARDGDYAIAEFHVTVHGATADIEIIQSSTPKINDDVVRFLSRWRYRRDCAEGELLERPPMYQRIRMDFTVPETVDNDRSWTIAIKVLAQSSEPL